MIEILCKCGRTVHAPVSAAGASLPCKACGKTIRVVAAEAITDATALGDFDARFVVTTGPASIGETIALGGAPDLLIGKNSACQITLIGALVSRAHAKLTRLDFGPSRWQITDSNSRNGVIVNGTKIAEAELNDGDIVRIGEYTLQYVVGFPPAQATASIKATPKPGQITCRGCGSSYPAKTIICMECGINLKTGKALVTSKHIDENDLAIRADTWIRITSIFIWFGLFPIASEAFATYKPRATWIITIVTTLTSAIFLTAVISTGKVPPELKNYMLWAGTAQPQMADAAEIDVPAPVINRAPHRTLRQQQQDFEQLKEAIRKAAARRPVQDPGEFHWYQLLTNTLIHSGPVHLAGNLLFLLVFGLRVNELIGDLKMWIVYPLLAICSGGIYALAVRNEPIHSCIGASGAIMGLAGMYFIFFPVHKVHMAIWFRGGMLTGWRVVYKLFQMKGFWLLVLWVGLNDVLPTILQSAIGGGDHVAHWAHLGGFISGMLIATGLLVARQVDAHGADVFSIALGPKAWTFIGKPGSRSTPALA